MNQIEDIVKKFHLHQIENRKLDGDISIACYTSRKCVDSTRISTIDLKSLWETVYAKNKQKKMFACSIVATADKRDKVVCIMCDPHWHLYGNVSRLFSMPIPAIYEFNIEEVKSIEDAVRYGFAENGLDVIVRTQEEAFDDAGATCFMNLIFQGNENRIIFDLDCVMRSISFCLSYIHLELIHLELHNLQGDWNHMRLCLTVEKISSKTKILPNEEEKQQSHLQIHTSKIHDGQRQVFLRVFLCFTVAAIFVCISQSFRERILHIFF